MTDEVGAGRSGSGTERQDWDDGDEEASALLKTVGRQLKLWRERAGMTQAELGAAIGYSEEQVSSVERARRAPKAEFLRAADEALGAGGMLVAFAEDVARAKYPKKVRDLAKLEDEAVEIGAYSSHNVHGLLQTEDYTRALFRMRRPLLDEEYIENQVAARVTRQAILTKWPSPILSFVLEEVTLLRPLGGRTVWQQQLEHILKIGQLRNVEIQVMPTDREDHAGMGGQLQLLSARSGSRAAHLEVQQLSRVFLDPKEVQLLEARYGIIRAQALTPRESLAFIEKVLGET
ncbi:helix-turn-helix transcriptional regulator [Streptomyces sp. NPDC048442]|uniref:helix-turn-helix domain-containing protein n=1 Tax=Streptomyces sp. NPDC048442 TaxID=3154823 RepID=UPI003429DCF3